MPDLSNVVGPFRITDVVDSAHGGYFSFQGSTVASGATYTASNTAIFRSTTRFVWSPKNALAASYSTGFFLSASDSGVITITIDGAPSPAGAAGDHEWYFLAFNGGTQYQLD